MAIEIMDDFVPRGRGRPGVTEGPGFWRAMSAVEVGKGARWPGGTGSKSAVSQGSAVLEAITGHEYEMRKKDGAIYLFRVK